MTINKTLPVSLCMMLSAAALAADNTDAVMMDARPCLDIVSAIERLACFEEQADAAQRRGTAVPQQNQPVVSIPRNASPQPAQPAQPAQTTRQSQPQPALEAPQPAESASVNTTDSFEDNFGLPEEKINDGKEKAQANELIARVATLRELGPNRVLITLENGQAWEQMQSKRFILAEGDEVRIYPTSWGSSYRLSSQSHNGFIQVQRLR